MTITKETIKRTLKTFIQTFSAYLIVQLPLIDYSQNKETVKSLLLGTFVTAIASALAFVMNLQPKQNTESEVNNSND